jgi:hypothetical protein
VVAGLTLPVYLTAPTGDLSRLFILEKAGSIRIVKNGTLLPTAFLDISPQVSNVGEQGLLGLAFDPSYSSNGRFFVHYTDLQGNTRVSRFQVSADPDIADAGSEQIILTQTQPYANHNGGQLLFGPDGMLYLGLGDGGSAGDPQGRGQDRSDFLGSILRVDVQAGAPYTVPPDNPFIGQAGTRPEIWSYGLRNPWRFSFDRVTDVQWVGDVGQGLREEVDMPITPGGNYGWRVFEGFACTNNDPTLCSSPQNYIFPIFDYTHANGRCSITGGYVYRGSQGVLPGGTYVYGDYCSGEIFAWDGTAQSVLLDTAFNIASFGEDEGGELYVVNLGGSVSKIASTASCTYAISPTSATYMRGGGGGSVAVTTAQGCGWTAASNVSWITINGGSSGSGPGTVTYSVAPYTGHPKNRTGTMTIAGKTFSVKQTK